MRDRVSWRRAWSLFWKLTIMQSAVWLLFVYAYFVWISNAFADFMNEPESPSLYEECLETYENHPMKDQRFKVCEEFK